MLPLLVSAALSLFAPPLQAEVDRQTSLLIKQLGNPSFRQRDAAAKQLVAMGGLSRKALEAAVRHPDFEVREHARRLASEALDVDIRRRIDRFSTDDGTARVDLPGWNSFRKSVGSGAVARKFFIGVFSAHRDLLQELETDPEKTRRLVGQRCSDIQATIDAQDNPNVRGQPAQPYRVGLPQFAALMLAGMDEKVVKRRKALPEEEQDAWDEFPVAGFMGEPYFAAYLGKEDESPLFKKLFLGWLDAQLGRFAESRGRDASEISPALEAVRGAKLRDAVAFVEKVVALAKSSPEVRASGFLCLGSFGDKKHLKLIESYLKDNSQVSSIRVNRGGAMTYECQLRDVALGMTIKLQGEKPSQFGFDGMNIWGSRDDDFQYYCFSFTSEENRKATFKKWEEYAKQKGLPAVDATPAKDRPGADGSKKDTGK